jgi:hypothetical protein
MFQTVSGVGSSLQDKREKAAEKKLEDKKKWGPFQYFLIASSALVVVMWGVILLGGQRTPASRGDLATNTRVLLFMADSAVKRYAHFEGDRYPQALAELIPKYLQLSKEERPLLKKLSYELDPATGYRLTPRTTKPGEMRVILSSRGISYTSAPEEAVR